MFTFIAFLIGITIGIFSKKIFLNWLKNALITKRHKFLVKFHVYCVLHQTGSKLNEVIKTETVEVSIIGKNQEDAIKVVQEIINNEIRIEFESIEIDNS